LFTVNLTHVHSIIAGLLSENIFHEDHPKCPNFIGCLNVWLLSDGHSSSFRWNYCQEHK